MPALNLRLSGVRPNTRLPRRTTAPSGALAIWIETVCATLAGAACALVAAVAPSSSPMIAADPSACSSNFSSSTSSPSTGAGDGDGDGVAATTTGACGAADGDGAGVAGGGTAGRGGASCSGDSRPAGRGAIGGAGAGA